MSDHLTLEQTKIAECFNDKKQVTLFRKFRGFTSWYMVQVFTFNSAKDSFTYEREYMNTDEALKAYDRYKQTYNLKEIEKHEL